MCVRAALDVSQAVSNIVDTGTFLVTLNTSKKIRSASLMDYFRSCGIMLADVPRNIVIVLRKL